MNLKEAVEIAKDRNVAQIASTGKVGEIADNFSNANRKLKINTVPVRSTENNAFRSPFVPPAASFEEFQELSYRANLDSFQTSSRVEKKDLQKLLYNDNVKELLKSH